MNNATEALLELYFKQLKLSGIAQAYSELVREAAESGQSYSDFLVACLAYEVDTQKERQFQRRLKQARFPWTKGLGDFDFTVIPKLPKQKILSLAEGNFIRDKESVICLGPTGTGKTHIAVSLGLRAIETGLKVRFVKVVDLVQELLMAEKEYQLPRYLKGWRKIDLVILDELGYIELKTGGPLLFQFCADRYEKGSFVITTNLEFSRWGEVFNDVTLTTALLDRLTHRSHVLFFQGESYRFRESQQRFNRNRD